MHEILTEKYRPKNFDDIVSQNIAINNLRKFTQSPNIPHLIFTGPAGTGKTSTALIIARNHLISNVKRRTILNSY